MTHEIKLDISFCDAVYQGLKTFEVRNNDRGYQKGDLIKFIPVDNMLVHAEHPIKDKIYEITYVLSGWGIKEGYCVFAIKESEATKMTDITPKEANEILSHYTDLGYGVVIEGEDTSKIKQALSLASKMLANGTPYNPSGDCISRSALKEAVKNRFDNSEYFPFHFLALIDNAPTVEITEKQAINKLYETGWLIEMSEAYDDLLKKMGECRTCRHRDPEDKKCDCGGLERQGCPFPVSDDYFCKFYEKGGAE